MSTDMLVRRQSPNGVAIRTDAMTPADLGDLLSRSGFFADSKDAAQAAVKVMAGAELGFGPVASMTGIYIVKGKVTLSANLLAAAVKSHPRYDYKVLELDDTHAEIEFRDKESGETNTSKYTIEDAKKQGLAGGDNYVKTPRNMLFARAMSNGVKWYAPDVQGGPIYVPEDFGLTDEELEGAAEMRDLPATTPTEPSPWLKVADDGQMELAARRIAKLPLGIDGERFILEMGSHFDGVPEVCTKMIGAMWRRAAEAGTAEDLEAAQRPASAPEATNA
jgi:hypothetical protein